MGIYIKELKKSYGKRTVLNIEELNLEYGKKYAIIGANGSGKSTLLKAISKEIEYEGIIDIEKSKKVVYMPQQSFCFSMSVLNNLKVVYKLRDVSFRKDEAIKLLKDLDLLHLMRKNAGKLSGGETQRVALARTLCAEADILLLDELTASMDIKQAQKCQKVLDDKVSEKNTTLIYTTHSMYQAENLADYVIFLHDGKVAEIIEAKGFMQNAKSHELKEFLEFTLNISTEKSS